MTHLTAAHRYAIVNHPTTYRRFLKMWRKGAMLTGSAHIHS